MAKENYRLKSIKKQKTKVIGIRCTEREYNELKIKANVYTEGNISEYVLYCALCYKINKNDVTEVIEGIPKRMERMRE